MSLPVIGLVMYLLAGMVLSAVLDGELVPVKLWTTTVSYIILLILLYTGGFFS